MELIFEYLVQFLAREVVSFHDIPQFIPSDSSSVPSMSAIL
jgi:hypothetical protein